MSDVTVTAQDPNSEVYQGAKILHEKAVEPITKGFDHTVAQLAAGHSEITPQQANKEALEIYEKVRLDMGVATTTNIAIEAATLGQLENPMRATEIADRISGATAFAAKVAQMKYDAQWLTAYEYHLNATNPNKRPGPTDLIRFAFREVWDPVRRAELLAEGFPGEFPTQMLFQGYNQTWTENYWAAHWELPSVGQLNEMLHRRVITPDIWDRFVKYNDFDPVVRPWLKAISYAPYTRVDVRRMWELAVLSDDEVLSAYMDLGYDEPKARRFTLWTKIYTLSVELRARYSKGWITADDVLTELTAAGMPKDRAQVWIQRIVKAEKQNRTIAEKDLTKTEIIKGVKQGFLTEDDAIGLLEGLGYDAAESEYIIAINVEVASGSPTTYTEFTNLVNLQRKSQGLGTKTIPPKVQEIDAELSDLIYRRKHPVPETDTPEFVAELDRRIADLQKQSLELRSLKKAP